MRLQILLSFWLIFGFAVGSCAAQQSGTVPFIGCASDGQVGPRTAPKGKPLKLPIPQVVADKLAYYKAEITIGVLGPRGWHCFGTYGSSGGSLFVMPFATDPKLFFDPKWEGFRGEVIQISGEYGGTSGRWAVGDAISRLFPKYEAFVKQLIANGSVKATDFTSRPYPADKLSYKSDSWVEYETPAGTNGLGTQWLIVPNDQSIRGMKMLVGHEPDLVSLAIRLPEEMKDLTSVIMNRAEADAVKGIK